MYPRATVRPIERPVVSFILCLIGGLFIVVGGVFGLAYLSSAPYYSVPYYYGGYLFLSALGLVSGGLVLLAGAMIYAAPPHHVAWGIVAIVFSVISIFTGPTSLGGGFLVGMVVGIVGGALGIAWKSGGELTLADVRTCLACGRHVLAEYPICPYCGSPARPAVSPTPPPNPPHV